MVVLMLFVKLCELNHVNCLCTNSYAYYTNTLLTMYCFSNNVHVTLHSYTVIACFCSTKYLLHFLNGFFIFSTLSCC